MTAEKKTAILQPNYVPWKGYFDMIRHVDEFIFLDDVPYTKNDWRNRNQVKTQTGLQWLTIPVVAGASGKLIRDTQIAGTQWARQHWMTLVHNYSKASCFDLYRDRFEKIYMENKEELLSKVAILFIREINQILGITTRLSCSSEYVTSKDRTGRLVELCKAVGTTKYVSGPAARVYLEESQFNEQGIGVQWFDYTGYKEYNQLYPPFEHRVTILDLLFNEGPNAIEYLKTLQAK